MCEVEDMDIIMDTDITARIMGIATDIPVRIVIQHPHIAHRHVVEDTEEVMVEGEDGRYKKA